MTQNKHIKIHFSKIEICRQKQYRDLKPANLFLSHDDLDQVKLFIAGLDHSIKIENVYEELQILNAFIDLTGSTDYEPPETSKIDYDFKADIWQIGMIFYQIVNQDVYPVQLNYQGLIHYIFSEYKKEIRLKRSGDEFEQLIVACLSYAPKVRPDSQQLIERLIECFDDLGIDDEDSPQCTRQISMIESYGQLVQKTIPLRMLKSANL